MICCSTGRSPPPCPARSSCGCSGCCSSFSSPSWARRGGVNLLLLRAREWLLPGTSSSQWHCLTWSCPPGPCCWSRWCCWCPGAGDLTHCHTRYHSQQHLGLPQLSQHQSTQSSTPGPRLTTGCYASSLRPLRHSLRQPKHFMPFRMYSYMEKVKGCH